MKDECEKLLCQIKELYTNILMENEYNDWGFMLKAVSRGDISIRVQRDSSGIYTVHLFSNSHVIVIPDYILYILPNDILYGYNDLNENKIIILPKDRFYTDLSASEYLIDFKTALEEIIISVI